MKRTAALTVIISVVLLLTGCAATADTTDTASAGPAGLSAEQKAVQLGPPATEDGRAPAGGTVPVPAGPSSVEGVFCEMAVDGKVTQYRALQISAFSDAAAVTASDAENFTPETGFKSVDQAVAVSTKFAKVGAELEKLTADRNINVPSGWDERIDGFCSDVLAGK